jgi:hypothetical protein
MANVLLAPGTAERLAACETEQTMAKAAASTKEILFIVFIPKEGWFM